jgi:hypothetical protein
VSCRTSTASNFVACRTSTASNFVACRTSTASNFVTCRTSTASNFVACRTSTASNFVACRTSTASNHLSSSTPLDLCVKRHSDLLSRLAAVSCCEVLFLLAEDSQLLTFNSGRSNYSSIFTNVAGDTHWLASVVTRWHLTTFSCRVTSQVMVEAWVQSQVNPCGTCARQRHR